MASPTQWTWVWEKLQEMVKNRKQEAWWSVAIHRVTKNRTQFSDWTREFNLIIQHMSLQFTRICHKSWIKTANIIFHIIYETSRQSRFDARYWMLGAGALGWPRGMVQRGRREGGSGWGTHVYLWQIHFDIWQNQYNIVKLKKKKDSKLKGQGKIFPRSSLSKLCAQKNQCL